MWFLSFPVCKPGYQLALCSGFDLHLFRYSKTGKQLDRVRDEFVTSEKDFYLI
uniref:Uncharacterized protein n=1 Tax=Candidatus Methanogaster sp. ANME-2c ERB4 TaxID=2759911 RepID=A0A7G9YN17_9EURY|nr:hypothetical protein HONBAIEO_00040 [Methanosarcinales archaeon ANME-2c ERB4]QNO49401.1 hypothetical protein JHKIABMC_00007 [Methanosarcinales archaeon ANME-2c ERB4]